LSITAHASAESAVILGSGERIGKNNLPDNIAPAAGAVATVDLILISTIEELPIGRVMAKTSSLQQAADVLGIDQATLWRRRKTYDI
jgi:NtrC-family two-component system response regulator AlgB